ncbi:MAG: DNA repair protein RadC [Chlamydiota bacterium]|nr:DNA repair protein RadC [Chlamydiota bacterium]
MTLDQYTVNQLPLQDRPRERFINLGPEAVSNAELLAIILGSGTKGKSVIQLSQEIIAKFGSLKELAEATIEEICEIKGMGKAKAIQIKSATTLALRLSQSDSKPKCKIDNPLSAYHLLRDSLEVEKREVFVVILLDTKSYLITQQTVSIGTLSQSLVHPREVFYPAIRHKAASIIFGHNHPSGDPTPSKQDIEVTKTLVDVGSLMGIPVRDHLIIGNKKFISMRQNKIPGCGFR